VSFHGAILKGAWEPLDLLPGAYLALLTDDERVAIEARVAGLHLRDTMLLLGPAQAVSFAFLFRTPMSSTVAENVLQHGTGALAIDACRIAGDMSEFFSKTGKPRSGMGHAKGYGMGEGYGGDKANPPHQAGRWPSNVAFIHSSFCTRVGMRKVKGGNDPRRRDGTVNHGGQVYGGNISGGVVHASDHAGFGDGDGTESIAAWECAPNCHAAALDQQSGDRPSTLTGRADPQAAHGHPSQAVTDSWFSGGSAKDTLVYADGGGASRFFLQFANEEEFLAWLRCLLAREGDEIYEAT